MPKWKEEFCSSDIVHEIVNEKQSQKKSLKAACFLLRGLGKDLVTWGYSVSSPGQEAGEWVSPGGHTRMGSQDKGSQASEGMDRGQNCGEAVSKVRENRRKFSSCGGYGIGAVRTDI